MGKSFRSKLHRISNEVGRFAEKCDFYGVAGIHAKHFYDKSSTIWKKNWRFQRQKHSYPPMFYLGPNRFGRRLPNIFGASADIRGIYCKFQRFFYHTNIQSRGYWTNALLNELNRAVTLTLTICQLIDAHNWKNTFVEHRSNGQSTTQRCVLARQCFVNGSIRMQNNVSTWRRAWDWRAFSFSSI